MTTQAEPMETTATTGLRIYEIEYLANPITGERSHWTTTAHDDAEACQRFAEASGAFGAEVPAHRVLASWTLEENPPEIA